MKRFVRFLLILTVLGALGAGLFMALDEPVLQGNLEQTDSEENRDPDPGSNPPSADDDSSEEDSGENEDDPWEGGAQKPPSGPQPVTGDSPLADLDEIARLPNIQFDNSEVQNMVNKGIESYKKGIKAFERAGNQENPMDLREKENKKARDHLIEARRKINGAREKIESDHWHSDILEDFYYHIQDKVGTCFRRAKAWGGF